MRANSSSLRTQHRDRTYERAAHFEVMEPRRTLTATLPAVVSVEVASTGWSTAFFSHLSANNLGERGFAIPVGSAAQATALPWFNINRVSVRFSEDVDIQASDLALSAVNVPTLPVEDFDYDALTHVATWTLGLSLSNNQYYLELNADGLSPIIDLDGNRLDGEWVNGSDTFTSGDGTPGGDFRFSFNVLPGDGNQDGGVQNNDRKMIGESLGHDTSSSEYDFCFDVNGSGVYEVADMQLVTPVIGSTLMIGSPFGSSHAAPTAIAPTSTTITSATADTVLSLYDAFEHASYSDDELCYDIVSVSNEDLFDYVSVNTTSGALHINAAYGASGRSAVTVSARDVDGRTTTTTFMVDVNYVNQPPALVFSIVNAGTYTFLVHGSVSDADDDVRGMIVIFQGVFDARVTVDEDGEFEFAVIVEPQNYGEEFGWVQDFFDQSDVAEQYVG